MDLLKFNINDFRKNGFTVIPNFLTLEEVEKLKNECDQFLQNVEINEPTKYIFKSGEDHIASEYFIQSGDKIRYFFENNAFDNNGYLIVDKQYCVNKIGHALHRYNPIFKEITFSSKVKMVADLIGFHQPVIVQSMIIYKNPLIGDEVTPHQDASFLHTTPIRLFGLWIALEDVTLDNGCLWFIPGSHKNSLSRRFIRNPSPPPLLKFDKPAIEYPSDSFVPVLVDKGSCTVIDGLVVHRSYHNHSTKPRPVYTFHIIDSHNTQWSNDNWLQPTEQLPFTSFS